MPSTQAITLSEVIHECANNVSDACARRCDQPACKARGEPLPLKRELKAAIAQTEPVMTMLAAVNSRAASPAYFDEEKKAEE